MVIQRVDRRRSCRQIPERTEDPLGPEQLRSALARDELELHYQPIVDPTGRTVMAEGLVRWAHAERGMVMPDVIVPLAEQGGLLSELDRWVLRTGFAEATAWPDAVSVAVNLGGLLPDGAEAVDQITRALDETGLDPRRVVLEITETTLVDLPDRTGRAMHELARRGLRFAIDDFGTGYSSLARLKDLPAQILKLDRSLLPENPDDATNRAITRAVADISRVTGHRCVAEGVETAAQVRLLTELGVDTFQGSWFSSALPPATFHQQLEGVETRPKPAR